MKTKIKGTATEYYADEEYLLCTLRGKTMYIPPVETNISIKALESYAKQLLEAVEAAKLVINMNEKG